MLYLMKLVFLGKIVNSYVFKVENNEDCQAISKLFVIPGQSSLNEPK
jgi:hypothetical protein